MAGDWLRHAVAEMADGLMGLSPEEIDRRDKEEHDRCWHRWLNNPYCLWLLFLEMVPDYGPQHKEWEVFGTMDRTFPSWFRYDHDRVFGDGLGANVDLIHSPDDAERHFSSDRIIVSINRHSTIKEIVEKLEGDLLPYLLHHVKAGRPPVVHPASKALRSFCKRPHVPILKKIWYLYQKKKYNSEMTPYQLHEALYDWLKLGDPYKILPGDSDLGIADKKKQAMTSVSKYLYQAEQIMEGVAEGKFPRFD